MVELFLVEATLNNMTDLLPDLSRESVWTQRTNDPLPKSRVEQVIDDVYDEFSSDASIQFHLIEFCAYHQGYLMQVSELNLLTLRHFEYLKVPSTETNALRTKGRIALNMVLPELIGGELSACLVEPFREVDVLPILYQRWKARRNGWDKPPLNL